MGLILGIDLCDSFSQISIITPEGKAEALLPEGTQSGGLIPTAMCRLKEEDAWLIGTEAYQRALMGQGTMVDKLVMLLTRDGSATLVGRTFSAVELMAAFIGELLALPRQMYPGEDIEMLSFSLRRLEPELLERMEEACRLAGLPRERVRFLSHTECFGYYVAAQPRELWPNQVVAFDLTDAGLDYFEMKVIRGRKPQVMETYRQPLDEGFDLDLLETTMGERMADRILSAAADRMLQRKLVSSVFLTGEGFSSVEWAPEFVKKLCNKRKVFGGQHLFADGAALAALDGCRKGENFPFLLMCEGRLTSSISLYAIRDGKNQQLLLASAGSNWYEARSGAEFILDDVHALELLVTSFSNQRVETISLSLDELPARPNKTTRIRLDLFFLSENQVRVQVEDRGFGELFPASGLVIRKDFLIS